MAAAGPGDNEPLAAAGAPWDEAAFESAIRQYTKIILPYTAERARTGAAHARSVVRYLEDTYDSEENGFRFIDFVRTLPAIDVKVNEIVFNVERAVGAPAASTKLNVPSYLGKGATGVIFKGQEKFEGADDVNIYKKIVLTGDKEKLDTNIREVFLEAWFHTVLGLDEKKYSDKICKIKGLYRNLDLDAASAAPAAAGGAGAPPAEINFSRRSVNFPAGSKASVTLFIIMEPAGARMSDILPTLASANIDHKLSFATMKSFYKDLGELLLHLNTKYGFFHRDLHQGNVLIKDKSITMIDYGRCVINKWNKTGTYRSEEYDGELGPLGDVIEYSSFDLLQFLVSMVENFMGIFAPLHTRKLMDLIDRRIYTALQSVQKKGDAVFWQAYPNCFEKYTIDQLKLTPLLFLRQLKSNPALAPAGFLAALEAPLKGGRQFTIRRRKSRQSRRRGSRQRQ